MKTVEILKEAYELAGVTREQHPEHELPSYDALDAVCRKYKIGMLSSAAYDCLRYVASQFGILSLTELDLKAKDLVTFDKVWMTAILFAHAEYSD